MATRRIPWVVPIALFALAIAAAGSYYGQAVLGGGAEKRSLSNDRPDAENVITFSPYIGQPDDFSRMFSVSEIVVMGVIDQLYDAKWTTSDGVAPEEITADVMKDPTIHIRTPAQLTVTRVFKGDPVGKTLKFSFPGGTVGDTAFVHAWNDVLEEGATVILFLSKGADDSPANRVEEQGLFPRMHLVVKGDIVEGPLKEVPLADIVEQLKEDDSESFSDGGDR